jgi:predicted DNA-binding transcriptional regulator YafY
VDRPTSRVLTLLELLQSGGARTAAELADRLGVDERTVRRYVGHLRELGIPVVADRGRYGGYRLGRGHRLPPLMLTDAEATAVMLGLGRGGAGAGDPLARATAAAKIARVLPKALAATLEPLLDAPGLDDGAAPSTAPDAALLLALADAARRGRVVALDYTDRSGHGTERRMAPYDLALVGGRWYVVGPDPARGDEVRVFRLDRIGRARVTGERFERPAGFDAAAHVRRARATAPYRHTVELRVLGTADEVQAALPADLAVVGHPDADGWRRVVIRAETLDWLPPRIAAVELPVIVDAPPALRERVRELGRRLIDAAAPGSLPVGPTAP